MTRRWLLGCAFFIAAALSVHPEAASWNVTSRLAAVESLVDRGTFAIEDSAFKTGDRYRYAGHFYSDKPIVPAIVGAALVEALRAVRIDVVANRQVLLAVLTIATVCVPFGISVAAFAGLLRALGSGEREAEAIAIVAGGATLAFPYATVLINHVPAFACLVVGLELLVRAAKRSAYLFVGGALFALAVGIDSSYVVFLVLAPIVIGRTSLRRHLLFAIGAAAVLAPLAASNVLLSGNVRPPDTNATLYDYPGSAFAHGYVLGSIGYRSAADLMRYAFSVTFGER